MTLLPNFIVSLSLAIGVLSLNAVALLMSAQSANAADVSKAEGVPLLDGVYVRDQIALETVAALQANKTRTLINLRPDGEDQNQPVSANVESAASTAGLAYAYIPTPNGEIPDTVVEALGHALANTQRPAVLYCRSGKRSTRVWALAEASRSGGHSITEIVAAVKAAGQTVDDLMPRIETRFSKRSNGVKG